VTFFNDMPVTEIPVPVRTPGNDPEYAFSDSSNTGNPGAPNVPATVDSIGGNKLAAYLDTKGLDGQILIAESAQWFQERGFSALPGVDLQPARAEGYADRDDATLLSLSKQGNLTATQELAARRTFSDPTDAIRLYVEAAEQGSIYALLRIASLLETVADITTNDLDSYPDFRAQLSPFSADDNELSLKLAAFAYALAAVRDGGKTVASPELLVWIDKLGSAVKPGTMQHACKVSEKLHITLAEKRRRAGLAPVSTEPPPVFFGDPDLESKLPCAQTRHAVFPLLRLDDCATYPVQFAPGEIRTLYVCATH